LQLKCEQYWPEGEEQHGEVSLRMVREDTLAFYTLRTFTLRHTGPATHTNKRKKVNRRILLCTYQAKDEVRSCSNDLWCDMSV
jgi:hypothetical protein